MFDYNRLTTQQKIEFQKTKTELYQEAFLNSTPNMQKIDNCFSALEKLGYMDDIPELDLHKSLSKFKKNCLSQSVPEPQAPQRSKRISKNMVRIILAAAILFVIICMAVFARNTTPLDVWGLLGDKETYVYDEDVEVLHSLQINDGITK